jgi:hypothetical protein
MASGLRLFVHGGNRRTSGADDLRSQSDGILATRPEDPKPNEATGTKSMVEDDEHDANDLLEVGLEQALSLVVAFFWRRFTSCPNPPLWVW